MLTDVHKAAGAVYGDAFGTSYPLFFVHPGAEYRAITKYLGLIDLNHWSVLSLTGKDRVSFLNNMITNDIAGLEPGHGVHSVLTTVKGKIVSELFVFVREDDVLILVAQGDAAETKATLEKHIIMEDVTLTDRSDDYGVLALEGAPKKAKRTDQGLEEIISRTSRGVAVRHWGKKPVMTILITRLED